MPVVLSPAQVTALAPPYPGEWVTRESLPGLLDDAKSLGHICYWSPLNGGRWETGITSERPVRYFVRTGG